MRNKTTENNREEGIITITPIAIFRSPLKTKFGIPKQSGLATSLTGSITFCGPWRNPEALRGMEGFDFLWIIWGFSANRHMTTGTTVRPPVLGGNKRMGVWATRSPFRPNNLGLSSVKIERIELETQDGPTIYVSGADLMDGTPIYDIKPYVTYADSHPEAKSGFTDASKLKHMPVTFNKEAEERIDEQTRVAITEILSLDPRPQYHNDEKRIYGMTYDEKEVKFCVKDGEVRVISVDKRGTN